MLLPKMIAKNYVYNKDVYEDKLYSIKELDQIVSTAYTISNEDSIKVETIYFRNKIKHILKNKRVKIYLSDEQYFNALRIYFYRNHLYLGEIKSTFDDKKFIGYQLKIHPLIRKNNSHTKTLVKKIKIL